MSAARASRTPRLYLRLYLAFLGVLVALVILSAGVVAVIGRTPYPMLRQGPRIAAHVARALPPIENRQEFEERIEEAHEELALDLAVIGPDATLIAEAGTPIPLPGEVALQKAMGGAVWVAPGLVGAPLKRSHGILLVRVPTPEGARRWPLRTLATIGVTLLASAALLYPLSRTITRPLERLTAAAEAFGRGDFSTRSGLRREDEVGRLARSFDEMAARIEAARRAEKELLANISHELRTPLARLKVAMELIEPGAGAEGDALRKRLAVVGEEVEELSRLVSDVLTAARLDLATLPLRKVTIRVGELLEKARERGLALSAVAPIELKVEGAPVLEGDEGLLARALDTLIDNARKHGGEAPVRVEASAAGGRVRVAVTDAGPGFDPEELPRVFDPFFRGSKARTQSGGWGLGLSLARRVVQAHGGTIAARNPPAGGACVELDLPAGAA